MEEVWKDIKGYKDRYQVSNLGRVKLKEYTYYDSLKRFNHKNSKILKIHKDNNGYLMCDIDGKKIRVHRLVATYFVDNPNNYNEVNHIDGNKSNAVYTNLEWVTHKQNYEHALKTGLLDNARKIWSIKLKERQMWKKSSMNNRRKVSSFDRKNNKLKTFNSLNEASKFYNLYPQQVWQLCNNKRNYIRNITFRYEKE